MTKQGPDAILNRFGVVFAIAGGACVILFVVWLLG